MESLSCKLLKENNYQGYVNPSEEEKILQFGDGNFLRGFVDYFFDICCEKNSYNGKIAIVQPVSAGKHDLYEKQNGYYTLYTRGINSGVVVNDSRVITSVSRCLDFQDYSDEINRMAISDSLEYIVSNTTEAGIVFNKKCDFDDEVQTTFPSKLTKLLYKRYVAGKKGVIVLSCELIDKNGEVLLDYVIKHSEEWLLGEDFIKWLREENLFCSTLVDRIVPGAIKDPEERSKLEEKNGYADSLAVAAEVFYAWIIQGPDWLEKKLPFKKAGLAGIEVVPDIVPYKKRKVRILNGAHTGIVLGAYLAGFDIVRDCVSDPDIGKFMEKMLSKEIIPCIDMDEQNLNDFAASVKDRFLNPYIDHQLMSISINSVSKWRTRNLPSLIDYHNMHHRKVLPECLSAGLAFLLDFYGRHIKSFEGETLICSRPSGQTYGVRDDDYVLRVFYGCRDMDTVGFVNQVLGDENLWNCNLLEIPGLAEKTVENLDYIKEFGEMELFRKCVRQS